MRTFTALIIILSAQIEDKTITGLAIDGDIAIDFAVANTDVNQRLFVPEAQLVVTGKFRVAKAVATIGAWISNVVAVVSIPAPVEPETAIPAEVIEPTSLTPAQKRATTLAAKKAKAVESELIHF